MLKLRITQPGAEDQLVEIDANEVILGRSRSAEVTIDQPFVSNRHARLVQGLILMDLDSRNGTFMDGVQIYGPTRVTPSGFFLGGVDSKIHVQVEGTDGNEVSSADLLAAREDLDEERRRSAKLVEQVETLQQARPGNANQIPTNTEMEAELLDARRRIAALKQEIADRDEEASEGIQARLAMDQAEHAQAEKAAMAARIAELEAAAPASGLESAKQALATRVGELEGLQAEQIATIERLESELETLRNDAQPAIPASDLFFKLQAENAELRSQLAKGQPEAPSTAPEVFFKLQAENAQLKKRVDELESDATSDASDTVSDTQPSAGGANPKPAPAEDSDAGQLEALRRENHDLRLSKAGLVDELDSLRLKVSKGIQSTPMPATPVAPQIAHGNSPSLAGLLQQLAQDDVDDQPALIDESPDAFLAVELFRFVRESERVITRISGSVIGMYDMHTFIPDTEGNLRTLIGDILAAPSDTQPRHDFLTYAKELRKWLVVTVGANKLSAERFAEKLKSDLSKRGLTTNKPLPFVNRLGILEEAELWRRAAEYLRTLTADVIEDRYKTFLEEAANELLARE